MSAWDARVVWLALAVSATGCELVFPPGGTDPDPVSDGPMSTSDDAAADASSPPPPPSCPKSYAQVGIGRYRFVTDDRSWANAAAFCASDTTQAGPGWFTHLAVIGSEEEAQLLETLIPAQWGWIGMSDRIGETVFQWVTVEETGGYHPPWLKDQPDNGAGTGEQNCVRWGSGGIDDDSCTATEPYLCECDGYPDDPERY